jgi:subtilisin family serine protease
MPHRLAPRAGALLVIGCVLPALSQTAGQDASACRPLACSTLIPSEPLDRDTNDCAYRAGNQWWLDYVAAPVAWGGPNKARPVTIAIFDDGADTSHVDLRRQLWVNESESQGRAGIDDDDNGYVDDVHGWDFVDEDPRVAPEGECVERVQHGTFMASLAAAERNNQAGIAGAGAEGARLMILRIVGCGRDRRDHADAARLSRALDYATRMGARILNFSAHWNESSPELDAAFAEVADRRGSPRAAIVVASVPNKGEPAAGYPAAYPFRRIVRAVPIGNGDRISPGVSPVVAGLNFGAPSACVVGATQGPASYGVSHGSSNSTAILAGLLAAIWSNAANAGLSADELVDRVIAGRMLGTPRRSLPGSRDPYRTGVPLADACVLDDPERPSVLCRNRPGLAIMVQ